MSANLSLTGDAIKTSYVQLLHVSDTNGITTTGTQIYDGDGTASSLFLGTVDAKVILGTSATNDFAVNDGTTDLMLLQGDSGAGAIAFTLNDGTADTMVVTNTQGTGEAAISLIATAGGLNVDVATGKNIDFVGGQFIVLSNEDVASAITLTANTGTSETILVTNSQGTSAASIALLASAGGITITGTNTVVAIDGGTGGVSVGDHLLMGVNAGVTANTGSAQGGDAQTKGIVQISISANAGDAITLPTAVAGLIVMVANDGANSADVFPAASDDINEAGANVAYALAADKNALFFAHDATNWSTILTA